MRPEYSIHRVSGKSEAVQPPNTPQLPTLMQNFDFIARAPFRESLEADYAEMERCMAAKAYKSVQVLAGSIIEALLIDYLVDTNDPPRSGKDPHRLDLAEAVEICKAENVLSERSADLSSVIRSYRNLIHPGRTVRLDEPQPTDETAGIAVALVSLIVREVAKVRRNHFGLTADQLLSKIVRDSNALSILRHLLQDTSQRERERLLVDLLPEKYMELKSRSENDDWFQDRGEMTALTKAFRVVFDTLEEDGKARIAQQFVKVLREADGEYVVTYGAAFFRSRDLEYLPPAQMQMVKEHLLSLVKSSVQVSLIARLEDIERFLEPEDVRAWIDPIVRTLLASGVSDEEKEAVQRYFDSAVTVTKTTVDETLKKRLENWCTRLRAGGREEDAALVEKLKEGIADSLPF